jgi:hypothetical protein
MKTIVKEKTRIKVCNWATQVARLAAFVEGHHRFRRCDKSFTQITVTPHPHEYWRFFIPKIDDAIAG